MTNELHAEARLRRVEESLQRLQDQRTGNTRWPMVVLFGAGLLLVGAGIALCIGVVWSPGRPSALEPSAVEKWCMAIAMSVVIAGFVVLCVAVDTRRKYLEFAARCLRNDDYARAKEIIDTLGDTLAKERARLALVEMLTGVRVVSASNSATARPRG